MSGQIKIVEEKTSRYCWYLDYRQQLLSLIFTWELVNMGEGLEGVF